MAVVNGYCTEAELRGWNRSNASATTLVLERAIEACARGIDRFCQRTFFQVTEPRVFDAEWIEERRGCVQVVALGPFNDLAGQPTSVKTDDDRDGTYETTWTTADYQLLPLNPNAGPEQRPYTELRTTNTRAFPEVAGTGRVGLVQITGPWGWPAIPHDINQACLMHAARIFNRKESPQGVAGWGDFGAIRVGRTDPDVIAFLEPFQYFGGVGFA